MRDGNNTFTETQRLTALVEGLTRQNADLQDLLHAREGDKDFATPWPVLYRVYCMRAHAYATYLDQPVCVRYDGSDHHHLDGRRRISDESDWEEKHTGIPFFVYMKYRCADHSENQSKENRKTSKKGKQSNEEDKPTEPSGEEVVIRSLELRDELNACILADDELSAYHEPDFIEDGRLRAPYLMYYHFPDVLQNLSMGVPDFRRPDYDLLIDYFKKQTAQKAREADQLFGQGEVTPQYMPYLFAPGGFLIQPDTHGLLVVKQQSVLHCSHDPSVLRDDSKLPDGLHWTLETEAITFDGKFHKGTKTSKIVLPELDTPVNAIEDLELRPLKYSESSNKENLPKRGRVFYSCRNGRYMVGSETDEMTVDVRYMTDTKTYHIVHLGQSFGGDLLRPCFEAKIEADQGTDVVAG